MAGKIIPDGDIRDAILDAGGEQAYKCYQCGTCMAVCPWSQVDSVVFPVYRTPQAVKYGSILNSEDPEDIEREVTEVYRCVGCEACSTRCPHAVSLPRIMRAIRRILVEFGSFPPELSDSVTRIQSAGNPFGEERERRADWASDADVPIFDGGQDFVYSPCCVPAYDPRAMKVARATVNALRLAGVSFGILGGKESCCSESLRRVGAEDVFQETASSNITAFAQAGATNVLVTSPHCMCTFANEYPEMGADFQVTHQVVLFQQLIREEKLNPSRPLGKRVVYHDPCTLGRQSGIFEQPREVLSSIPDLELLEIPHFSHENSLCCGGGSGGIWLERPKGERMSDIRVEQAAATGADILAVACPYCLQMFEDSVKTMGLDLEVKDIAELLADSLV
ncbi:MAG: (Fe-S)-binding protein [bacterium]|nr:(Fe-S)-binding protein [bacterium]